MRPKTGARTRRLNGLFSVSKVSLHQTYITFLARRKSQFSPQKPPKTSFLPLLFSISPLFSLWNQHFFFTRTPLTGLI
jgi:hypothetical protein